AGLLLRTDAGRNKLTVRVTLEGVRREVLHFAASSLSPLTEAGPTGPTDPIDEFPAKNGPVSWASLFDPAGKPGQQTGPEAPEKPPVGPVGPVGPVLEGGEVAPGGDSEESPAPPHGARMYGQDSAGRPCSLADENLASWTWGGASRWYSAL